MLDRHEQGKSNALQMGRTEGMAAREQDSSGYAQVRTTNNAMGERGAGIALRAALFHVELNGREPPVRHFEALARLAKGLKFAMQRGDNKLHRLRRHLPNEVRQPLVVQFGRGIIQQ
jgi:hypothetical protein